MPYHLQSSKGGRKAEKVYTMSIDVQPPSRHKVSSAQRPAKPSGNAAGGNVRLRARRTLPKPLTPQQKKRKRQKERRARIYKLYKTFAASEPEVKVRTVRAREKVHFPVTALFACLLCSALFMYIIFNMIQLNEFQKEIKQLQNQLADLEIEKKELEVKLERKNDLMVIEREAKELGMVRADELSKYHVTITPEDRIEIMTGE